MNNTFWLVLYIVFLGLVIIGIDALFFNLLPTDSFGSAFLSLVFIVLIAGIIIFIFDKLTNKKHN